MKAVVKVKPEPGIDILDIDIPTPKDDEVLVKIRATGLCGSDLHVVSWEPSFYWMEDLLPLTIGHEASGEVVEKGKNISDKVHIGDRLVIRPTHPCGHCYFCRTGQSIYCVNRATCGIRKNGALAEYCVINEDQIVPIPDNMTWEQGAIVEPIGVSANAVFHSGIKYGDFVVIIGPGPIGLFASLVAKGVGAGRCVVIGTSKDAKRLEVAKEMGADKVLMSDQCNAVEEIMNMTDGVGANVTLECVGAPPLLQQALDMTMKTGTVGYVGISPKLATIDITDVVHNSKKIVGCYSGPCSFERTVAWLTGNNPIANLAMKAVSHNSSLIDAKAAIDRAYKKENIKEIFTRFD